MFIDRETAAAKRRNRVSIRSVADPNHEKRVRYLATAKGLPIPIAREVARLWDRIEQQHGAVTPELFTAAVQQELEAGKPWARTALDVLRPRNAG